MNKTVIVGTSNMWVNPAIISSLVALILSTTQETTIAVRGPRGKDETASNLENAAIIFASKTGRPTEVYRPTGDRATVYERDFRLVEGADMVVAYFDPGSVMDGGTGHVVKAAMDRQIKVEAYTTNDDGELELVGSDDGLVETTSHDSDTPEFRTEEW